MTRVEKEIRAVREYNDGLNGVAVINNTFWLDFGIAEKWGAEAVRETYRRAFEQWKSDIRYMTALCITLNHKLWQLYGKDNELAKVYDDLWEKCDQYILDCENAGTDKEKFINFNSEEIAYFIQATD